MLHAQSHSIFVTMLSSTSSSSSSSLLLLLLLFWFYIDGTCTLPKKTWLINWGPDSGPTLAGSGVCILFYFYFYLSIGVQLQLSHLFPHCSPLPSPPITPTVNPSRCPCPWVFYSCSSSLKVLASVFPVFMDSGRLGSNLRYSCLIAPVGNYLIQAPNSGWWLGEGHLNQVFFHYRQPPTYDLIQYYELEQSDFSCGNLILGDQDTKQLGRRNKVTWVWVGLDHRALAGPQVSQLTE